MFVEFYSFLFLRSFMWRSSIHSQFMMRPIAIIRTFVVGFLLLGLVTIYRMIELEKVATAPKLLPARLSVLLIAMIVTGGIFGFLSPKLDPQWDDPVPFVRAAVGVDGGMEKVKEESDMVTMMNS